MKELLDEIGRKWESKLNELESINNKLLEAENKNKSLNTQLQTLIKEHNALKIKWNDMVSKIEKEMKNVKD